MLARLKMGVRKGLQKGDQRPFFFATQVEIGADEQYGIGQASAVKAGVVVVDHFFQRWEAAVVHIGGCVLDIAQSRGDEFAAVEAALGKGCQTRILGVEIEAVVVELVVGK